MATYYWVGGAGTWNNSSTTNWSATSGGAGGAGVPTASDNVIFNSSSGTGTCTVASTAAALNVSSLASSAITIQFSAAVTFSGALSHEGGTINLNGNSVSFATYTANSSTSARTLAFGAAGGLTISGSNATVFSVPNHTGLTLSGSKNVTLSYSGGVGTRTVVCGNYATTAAADAFSILVGPATDTVDISSQAFDTLNFTSGGNFTGTLTSNGLRSLAGSITFSSGMTISGITGSIGFYGTGSASFTTNGKTVPVPLFINGAGGTVNLVGSYTSSSYISFDQGTLSATSTTVNVTHITSASTGIRGLTITNSTINLSNASSSATVFTPGSTTNVTISASGSTIVVSSSVSTTFAGAGASITGLTYGTLTQAGTGTLIITGSSTFSTIGTSGAPRTISIQGGTTQTLTSGLNIVGTSANRNTLNCSTAGFFTLSRSSGTVSVTWVNLASCTGTGGAIWVAYNSINNGSNTNWNFSRTLYWVGGTGTWDATAGTKWALTSGGTGGEAVPTRYDSVFFNAASGANTITLSTGNSGPLDCTGFTGTLTGGGSSLPISGSVTLSSGMTATGLAVYVQGVIVTGLFPDPVITTAGRTIASFTNGTLISLADALTCTGTVTAGSSFTTNGYSITALEFNSSNSVTRTLNLGASTITLSASGTGGSQAWSVNTQTGLTLNAGTSTITFTGAAPALYLANSLTYNNMSFTSSAASGDIYIYTGGATISGTMTFTAPAAAGITQIRTSGNLTIGTMVASGASDVRRLYFSSNTTGTARSLTITTWSSISDIDFEDITLNSSRSGTRLGNRGGNTNITFPAAKTVYWNLAGANNWSATGWATSSGGTPASGNFPLAQDTAVIDNSSAGTSITMENAKWAISTLSGGSRTSAITINLFSTGSLCYGGWTNGSGFTLGSGASIEFRGRGSYTYTANGKSLTSLYVLAFSGTLSLGGAASCTTFYPQIGTTNLAGHTLTCSSGVVISTTFAKNLTFNGGTLSVAGGGFNNTGSSLTTTAGTGTGVINFTGTTANFISGGATYNCTVNCACTTRLTIDGSPTITTLANSVQPTNLRFTSGTTTTVTNFNVSGTAGNLVTIDATTTSAATLSKASGTVNANYLNISYSTATGGATWNALNSTNGGNNTGWIFPSVGGGNFLAFFM